MILEAIGCATDASLVTAAAPRRASQTAFDIPAQRSAQGFARAALNALPVPMRLEPRAPAGTCARQLRGGRAGGRARPGAHMRDAAGAIGRRRAAGGALGCGAGPRRRCCPCAGPCWCVLHAASALQSAARSRADAAAPVSAARMAAPRE